MEFTVVDMENLKKIGAKRYKIWRIIDGEYIDTGKTVVALSHEGALRKVGKIIFPLPWIGCNYAVSGLIDKDAQ